MRHISLARLGRSSPGKYRFVGNRVKILIDYSIPDTSWRSRFSVRGETMGPSSELAMVAGFAEWPSVTTDEPGELVPTPWSGGDRSSEVKGTSITERSIIKSWWALCLLRKENNEVYPK